MLSKFLVEPGTRVSTASALPVQGVQGKPGKRQWASKGHKECRGSYPIIPIIHKNLSQQNSGNSAPLSILGWTCFVPFQNLFLTLTFPECLAPSNTVKTQGEAPLKSSEPPRTAVQKIYSPAVQWPGEGLAGPSEYGTTFTESVRAEDRARLNSTDFQIWVPLR